MIFDAGNTSDLIWNLIILPNSKPNYLCSAHKSLGVHLPCWPLPTYFKSLNLADDQKINWSKNARALKIFWNCNNWVSPIYSPFMVKIKQPGLQLGIVKRYRKTRVKVKVYMNRRKLAINKIKKFLAARCGKVTLIKCRFNHLRLVTTFDLAKLLIFLLLLFFYKDYRK